MSFSIPCSQNLFFVEKNLFIHFENNYPQKESRKDNKPFDYNLSIPLNPSC